MERESHADAGVAEFVSAQSGGGVCGVAVRDPGQFLGREAKDLVLVVREGIVGFVGVGHVGGKPFDGEIREFAQAFCEFHGGFEFEPEAVKAGIDLDMHEGGHARGSGCLRERLAQVERVAGECEA